jgi:hypothetical protein
MVFMWTFLVKTKNAPAKVRFAAVFTYQVWGILANSKVKEMSGIS